MVIAQSAPQPTAPAATLPAGGGGSGNSTASVEVMRDTDGTLFLRRYPRDTAGTPGAAVDTTLDGTTGYSANAGAVPIPESAAEATITLTEVDTGNQPLVTTAGNRAVHYVVQAGACTLDGITIPVDTGHTFEIPGRTVPAMTFATDATGVVLVIEEAD